MKELRVFELKTETGLMNEVCYTALIIRNHPPTVSIKEKGVGLSVMIVFDFFFVSSMI